MVLRKLVVALLCAAASCGCEKSDTSPNPLFTDQTFEAAWYRAKSSGKIFLVDATASWCGPCRQMEKTTWQDERVLAWVRENAVAMQLDVDEQSGRAGNLRIQAMPTVIVFKGDKEFDRVVGYQDADQMLAWLDGVSRGRRAIDALREAAGNREGPDGTVDIEARFELARALTYAGEYVEAADEFVWLWDNMVDHDPEWAGVRVSFMASDMADVAAQSDEAKAMFTALRDRYQPLIDQGTAGFQEMTDWWCLSQVIGDEEALLSWYERAKDDPRAAAYLETVAGDIYDLLVSRERWADAGRVHADPVGVVRQMAEWNAAMAEWNAAMAEADDKDDGVSDSQREEYRQYVEEQFRYDVTMLYACCLAAGRDDAAQDVAEILLGEQDTAGARQDLVRSALFVERPLEVHRRWLAEAEGRGDADEDLRRELESALAAPP